VPAANGIEKAASLVGEFTRAAEVDGGRGQDPFEVLRCSTTPSSVNSLMVPGLETPPPRAFTLGLPKQRQ
jgi:hypothetical protein